MFNPTWFYTGAVYAAAVTLARRAGVDVPKKVAVFFYALVFVFMYLPLTRDHVNFSADFLRTLPPWTYTTPESRALNPQLNDLPLQIAPWAHQVRESWRSLEAPLWNHLSGSGYPLLASAQSSAFSPLRLLGLPLSLAHAMTFEAAMKILLALTFMFLWCRRHYSELASVCGAVAFGFSTFVIVWLHFPLVTTACLVPAVFYAIDLLAERRTYARMVAGAAVWAAMLFGGHPETAAHTFFIAALYAMWIAFVPHSDRGSPGARRDTNWRLFGTLAASLLIAALLAAPLLVPFAEAVTQSKRFHELKQKSGPAAVPYSDWPSAKLLIQPLLYGEAQTKTSGPAHGESISGFAGTFGIAAYFALLAHVIATRAWRSREAFFLLATILVLGVIVSWPVIGWLFHLVFRLAANARMRLFLVLLLAVQTAAAVDLVRRDRRSLFIGITAAAALLLFTFGTTHFPDPAEHVIARTAISSAIGVLVVTAFLTLTAARPTPRNPRHSEALRGTHATALLLLLTAITAELWSIGRNWNPVVALEWAYPKTPLLRALDDLASKIPPNEPFRIVGNGATLFPNTSAVYGYEDVRAHDPMANARYIRFLSVAANYDPTNYFATWREWERGTLDFLNVRYIVTIPGGELTPSYRLVYDGSDGRIFENPHVLPRFYAIRNVMLEFRDPVFDARLATLDDWRLTAYLDELTLESKRQAGDFFDPRPASSPNAVARIVAAAPTSYRIRVSAPRYSLVASSVPWWPGWKVERNGVRIEPTRVNGAFLGFVVPPGEADVRVWYDPWTFRAGLLVSLATLAALIAYPFIRR